MTIFVANSNNRGLHEVFKKKYFVGSPLEDPTVKKILPNL